MNDPTAARKKIVLQLEMLELTARYSRYDQTNEDSIELAANAILSTLDAA